MPLWKITLSYDGTHLHGWQIQPALPTVQGHLADALTHITGEHMLPQGSGRTDAGVHALGQVASVFLESPIPAANLHSALNRVLPSAIRVLSVTPASSTFHARHSARAKTYEYRIFPRRPLVPADETSATPIRSSAVHEPDRICSPMLAHFVWDCPLPLCLPRLQSAATHILGTHDFTSFAAADTLNPQPSAASTATPPREQPAPLSPERLPSSPNPCRSITHSAWSLTPENLLLYRITGSGFLHHMVRNLVGTFVLAGAGRLSPEDLPAILAARRRSAAGPTAPARGLFLTEVHYA